MAYKYNYFFTSDYVKSTSTSQPFEVNDELLGWQIRTDKNTTISFSLMDRNGNSESSKDKLLVMTKEGRLKIKAEIYTLSADTSTSPDNHTLDTLIATINDIRDCEITIPEEYMTSDAMGIVIEADGTYDGTGIVKSIFYIYSNKPKIESANFEVENETEDPLRSEGAVRIRTVLEDGMPYVKPIKAKIYASSEMVATEGNLIKEITIADKMSREHIFSVFESDGITAGIPYYYWIEIHSPFGSENENNPKPVEKENGEDQKPIILNNLEYDPDPGAGYFSSMTLLSRGPTPEGEEEKKTSIEYIRFTDHSQYHKLFDFPKEGHVVATVECNVFRGGTWADNKEINYSVKYGIEIDSTGAGSSKRIWSSYEIPSSGGIDDDDLVSIYIDTANEYVAIESKDLDYDSNNGTYEDVFSTYTTIDLEPQS